MDNKHIDPNKVFVKIEKDRRDGTLARIVTAVYPRYQSSLMRPMLLEEISSDGSIRYGNFRDGEFIPLDE